MEHNWIQHQSDDIPGNQRFQVKHQSIYGNFPIKPCIGMSARDEIQHYLARVTLKTIKHANKMHIITDFNQNLRRKSYTGKNKIEISSTLWTNTI